MARVDDDGVLTDAIRDLGDQYRPQVRTTLPGLELFELPHGQQTVGMIVFNGDLYVASTSMLWVLNPEHGLVPVEIAAAAPEAAPETEVYIPPDEDS